MKIISWNVNGIRAIQNKGFAETLVQLNADCILLQETKAQVDQIEKALDYLVEHGRIRVDRRKGGNGRTFSYYSLA